MFPAIASLCRRSAVSVSKRASPARFLSTAAPAGGRLLEYEVQNRVGIITLNRPSVLNALTVAMGDELGELIATGIDTSKVGACARLRDATRAASVQLQFQSGRH